MKHKTFIPAREPEFELFEQNFKSKLGTLGNLIGLSSEEITASQEIIDRHRDSYAVKNDRRTQSRTAAEENRLANLASQREIRRLAKRIKSSANYTTAIGEEFGIIGPEISPVDITETKPVLFSKINGHEVVLKFTKPAGEGVKIYSRRGTETDFTLLGIGTSPPFIDRRLKLDTTKPEKREYYAFLFESDKEIGRQSDVIEVIIS